MIASATKRERATGPQSYETQIEIASRRETKAHHSIVETQSRSVGLRKQGAVGHAPVETHRRAADSPDEIRGKVGDQALAESLSNAVPNPTCVDLMHHKTEWDAVVEEQKRIVLRLKSLARTFLGWQWDETEANGKKIKDAAAKIVDTMMVGKEVAPEYAAVADRLRMFVITALSSLGPLKDFRKNVETEMRAGAEGLPGYPAFKDVRGFTSLGFAKIVGETGDISLYANPAKLWKRLGLAPDESYKMETKAGTIAICKPRARRAVVWTIGDCLIKGNKGKYRAVYDDRKQYVKERSPDWTDGHQHRWAQRCMEKKLILDIWKEWNAAGHSVNDNHTGAAGGG